MVARLLRRSLRRRLGKFFKRHIRRPFLETQSQFESLERRFKVDRKEVLWWKLARAADAGLIYRLGTLANLPPLKGPFPGLFTIGMMRSFPERSLNDSTKQGFEAAEAVLEYLSSIQANQQQRSEATL